MSSRSPDPKPTGLRPLPIERQCLNREHSPPSHLHIPAGHEWVHRCPGCGQKAVIQSSDTIC